MSKVELPELGYEYNALEPYFDEETMKIHHTKHHQGYTDKYNAAIEKHPELEGETPEGLLRNPDVIPQDIKAAVRNNGGGYVNHKLFWQILKKDVELKGEIKEAIEAKWKNIDTFKEHFTHAASTLFGSGWTWLVVKDGKLDIAVSHNQDTPLTIGAQPILGLDVWEHAYYLKYQNKRPDYIEAFFKVINWEKVNELYLNAINDN